MLFLDNRDSSRIHSGIYVHMYVHMQTLISYSTTDDVTEISYDDHDDSAMRTL